MVVAGVTAGKFVQRANVLFFFLFLKNRNLFFFLKNTQKRKIFVQIKSSQLPVYAITINYGENINNHRKAYCELQQSSPVNGV